MTQSGTSNGLRPEKNYAGQGEWLIHVSLLVKVQPVFKRMISGRGIPSSLLIWHVKAKLQSNLW